MNLLVVMILKGVGNMILHTQFMITYFSVKDGKTITRKGTWTEKCKYFTSKVGNHMMTYFDMDAQGYRTAKGSWTVRY